MQQCLWFAGGRSFVMLVGRISGSLCLAQKKEPTTQLDPVIVTATRTEVPLRQTIRSVTAITEKDNAAQGAQTATEVVRGVPGLDVVRTESIGGVPSIFTRVLAVA